MEFPSLSCFEKLKGLRSTVGFVWKWDLAKGRICWKILWQKVNFGNDYKIFNIRYFSMGNTQNYVSSELTHFVGRSLENDEDRYQLLVKIIRTGRIRTRLDNGRGAIVVNVNPNVDISTNIAFNPDMVCFCDIPVSEFEIHMKKYSHFGLSYSKDFLIANGIRPVYYIPQDTNIWKDRISDIFNDNVKKFFQLEDTMPFAVSQFFSFHFFSFVKFFDPHKAEDDPDNFYMEREWRGLGSIDFQVNDITRIVLPSGYIKRFFQDIPDYNSHILTV